MQQQVQRASCELTGNQQPSTPPIRNGPRAGCTEGRACLLGARKWSPFGGNAPCVWNTVFWGLLRAALVALHGGLPTSQPSDGPHRSRNARCLQYSCRSRRATRCCEHITAQSAAQHTVMGARTRTREMRGDDPNVDAVRCRGGRKMHSDLVGTRKAERGARYCSVHCLLR